MSEVRLSDTPFRPQLRPNDGEEVDGRTHGDRLDGLLAELAPVVELLRKEEPRLLVVIGSGVTFGATGAPTASWQGLLEDGVSRLETAGLLAADLAAAERRLLKEAFAEPRFKLNEVLQRAEDLVERFGGQRGAAFASWLTQAVGSLEARPDRMDTLEALRDLHDGGALLLTTNYDDLLCDVTGAPPVTWQEPQRFLEVINRKRQGILHIHGHWSQPDSVILSRSSYDRVLRARRLRPVFVGLWLYWSWLYVGCGDGLDDPNLGRLLSWGKKAFGDSARDDFFVGLKPVAEKMRARTDKPGRLFAVAYESHEEDLPALLRLLLPAGDCYPFERLGPTAHCPAIRPTNISPLAVPFPSWHDYAIGAVPSLEADGVVEAQLVDHGWAYVVDSPSIGKTTLALRIANVFPPGQAAFYVSFNSVGSDEDAIEEVRSKFRRLRRRNVLLILDDVHRNPALARELWGAWQERPRASRLLLLATTIDRTLGIPSDVALAFLEEQGASTRVTVRPTPLDLWHVVSHVLARAGRAVSRCPPAEVLQRWHKDFGADLAALCAAATARRNELATGDWSLPPEAAGEWMRIRHLNRLDDDERANVLCLAAFAAQELEIDVPEEGLPHCALQHVQSLLESGLVSRHEVGKLRYVRYRLREPAWGRLILASEGIVQPTELLHAASQRSGVLALLLSSRLAAAGHLERCSALWQFLIDPQRRSDFFTRLSISGLHSALRNVEEMVGLSALEEICSSLGSPEGLAEHALSGDWNSFPALLQMLAGHGQKQLVAQVLTELEVRSARLEEQIWQAHPGNLVLFLRVARQLGGGGVAGKIWASLAAAPARVLAMGDRFGLGVLGAFLQKAAEEDQQELVTTVWSTLANEPTVLLEKARGTQLVQLAYMLASLRVSASDALVGSIWATLANDPTLLADQVRRSSAVHLDHFLTVARLSAQNAVVNGLWSALIDDSAFIAERAHATALGELTSFLELLQASGHEALATRIWEELSRDPASLASPKRATALGELASFLELARVSGQEVLAGAIWKELVDEPALIADRLSGAALRELASLIKAARLAQQWLLLDTVWGEFTRQPTLLADQARRTSLSKLAEFLEIAKACGREDIVDLIWEELAEDPTVFVRGGATLDELTSFFELARIANQGRVADRVAEQLARNMSSLIAQVRRTPLGQLGAFLNVATLCGQDSLVAAIAVELTGDPAAVADLVLRTRMGDLASFLKLARFSAWSPLFDLIWKQIAADPLSLVEQARRGTLGDLSALLEMALSSGHHDVVSALWNELAIDPTRLAKQAVETSLGDFGSFLEAARLCGREHVAVAVVAELEKRPAELIERVRSFPLGQMVSFLSRVADLGYGELAKTIWVELANHPAGALQAPLNDVGAALETARRQGETEFVSAIESEAEKNLEVLIRRSRFTNAGNLVGFLLAVPESIGVPIVSGLDEGEWRTALDQPRPFVEGISLARRFGHLGRPDLGAIIVEALLRRREYRDFGSLRSLTTFLRQVTPEQQKQLPEFLDAICTSKFLGRAFSNEPCSALAVALEMLALGNPPAVISRFWNPSLGIRLMQELGALKSCDDAHVVEVLQLLGCAQLVGWRTGRALLRGFPGARVARVAADVTAAAALSPPGETSRDERILRRFWLGMRVAAQLVDGRILVAPAALSKMIDLWRASAEAAAGEPGSTLHRLCKSMVRWLVGSCGPPSGVLVRTSEPLWTLTGFSLDGRQGDARQRP